MGSPSLLAASSRGPNKFLPARDAESFLTGSIELPGLHQVFGAKVEDKRLKVWLRDLRLAAVLLMSSLIDLALVPTAKNKT